ncbi:MAG: mechanosensitive ion channel domain-containing protein [Pseudomonadota bacterium]
MKTLQSIYFFLLQSCVIKACVVLILTGLLCFLLRILYKKRVHYFNQTPHFLSSALLKALYKPLLIFVTVMGVTYAFEWLCLGWTVESINLFHLTRHLFFIALFTKVLWDFVSLYKEGFLSRNVDKKVDRALIHALSQIAKITIIIITTLSLFQLFGLSIAGVLAFGGMGGIVIGFAAKDLLANVFGSLMLFLDRPFVIGDQIALSALKVEGQVKTIGWRVCEIITAEGRPIYIPNALFSNLVVENRSRTKSRRFSCCINLRYQDLAKVPAILEEIQAILKENPAIDKTRSIIVNLNELAHSSLNISVSAYTNLVDSADFLGMQQALYLEMLDCINRHGAKWAFQTNTVCLNSEALEASIK